MYEITTSIYTRAAERLCDAVGSRSYFSGSLEFTVGDTECRLVASLIVRHKQIEMPEGIVEQISGLIPIWWEFHTTVDGEELINDFDLRTLEEFIF